jgi:hypothetical protein
VTFQPAALPAELAEVLAQVRAWSGPGARDRLRSAGPDERAAWVAGLQQLSDAVSAAGLVAVDAFDANGDGAFLHGASSTQSWVRGACRVTGAEAAERVRLARASRDVLDDAVARTSAGELTYGHLRAIERGIRHLPGEQRHEAAGLLTELATVAPVADVRAASEHLRNVIDPDGALNERERQFERRYLTLSPLMDGMTAVAGLLDAEGAALLDAALQPFLVPSDPTDVRSAAQRRADGLLQIVQSACDRALLPVCGGERPQLRLLVDPRLPVTQHGETWPTGSLDGATGDRGVLLPAAVARIACDSQLMPILLDVHGVVTDLGRTRRLFSPQQRQLLAARDGGCRFPGCSRPPAHTDAHHVVPWSAGGGTDVPNALLLCRHHHRLVHEGGWSLSVTDQQRGSGGPVLFIGPRAQRLTSHSRAP